MNPNDPAICILLNSGYVAKFDDRSDIWSDGEWLLIRRPDWAEPSGYALRAVRQIWWESGA